MLVLKKLSITILFLMGFIGAHANCLTGTVAAPIVDSITVDIAGNVTLCWQPVADPDIVSYTIFMVNPLTSANDSINFVPSPTNCYTIPAGFNNSDNASVEYGVVAVDRCNNLSPVGVNYHNTMWLSGTFDFCTASVSLVWNPYDDFTSGPNVLYSIYVSISGGAYALAGTSLTTNFTYTGITQGPSYDFYIMAVENSGAGPFSSSSNDIRPPTGNALKIPVFNYLYTATVLDSQQINLQFYVDTFADVQSYRIKRAMSLSGPFNTIGTITAFTGMNPLVQFIDESDVHASNTFYFYQIVPVNTCGVESTPSNIGRTIWLKAKSDGIEATNTLTITQYDGWLGSVQKYNVFRSVGGIWESTPVATISPFSDTTVYVDDITDVFEGNGEFCYKIIATENFVAHVGGLPEASSTSNESCVFHEPLLYVPNSFVPSSPYNPEFKPVLTFANPASYLLQVYNKWGQKIFETEDVSVGWNGRVNNSGELSQVDSYVYVVQFQSADGEEYSKRGIITLIQ